MPERYKIEPRSDSVLEEVKQLATEQWLRDGITQGKLRALLEARDKRLTMAMNGAVNGAEDQNIRILLTQAETLDAAVRIIEKVK